MCEMMIVLWRVGEHKTMQRCTKQLEKQKSDLNVLIAFFAIRGRSRIVESLQGELCEIENALRDARQNDDDNGSRANAVPEQRDGS